MVEVVLPPPYYMYDWYTVTPPTCVVPWIHSDVIVAPLYDEELLMELRVRGEWVGLICIKPNTTTSYPHLHLQYLIIQRSHYVITLHPWYYTGRWSISIPCPTCSTWLSPLSNRAVLRYSTTMLASGSTPV